MCTQGQDLAKPCDTVSLCGGSGPCPVVAEPVRRLPLPMACTLRWGTVHVRNGCICLPDPGGQPYDLMLYMNESQKRWMREREKLFRLQFQRTPGAEDHVFCGQKAGEYRYRELMKP